jgi:hypothetical protein
MTTRSWFIGVLIIAGALLMHALVPRYEIVVPSPGGSSAFSTVNRLDRWTGSVETSAPTPRFLKDWHMMENEQ